MLYGTVLFITQYSLPGAGMSVVALARRSR